MDPFFDDKGSGGDYHALCEQRRRLRREKKRRRQRQLLGIGITGAAVLIMAVVMIVGKTSGVNGVRSWFQKENSGQQSASPEKGKLLAQNREEPGQTDREPEDAFPGSRAGLTGSSPGWETSLQVRMELRVRTDRQKMIWNRTSLTDIL